MRYCFQVSKEKAKAASRISSFAVERSAVFTNFVRKTPRLKCNCQNLFPIQIENALTSSPSIREAAVVAVPDAHYGEVVGAWIVLEENHEEIEGGKMSREDVKKQVSKQMNPQASAHLEISEL